MFFRYFLIITSLFFLTACKDKYSSILSNSVVLDKYYRPHEDTLLKDSIQPRLYSRLYKPNTFGMRTFFELPKSAQGKDLYVVVSGRTRNNYGQPYGAIAVTTHSEKMEQLCWELIKLRFQYTGINEWCEFRDSLKLPPRFYESEYTLINVMAYLPQGSENFDLDGLKVVVKQKD
jgi:hypothetical protein